MKVVIDTNVLVSALLKEHGSEAAVLLAVSDGTLTWCLSPAILAEYATVLHRPKFSKIPKAYINMVLALAAQAHTFTPSGTLAISRHEQDNRFYECAAAAQADYIVTGNAKHFPKHLLPTKIVNARQLLDVLKK